MGQIRRQSPKTWTKHGTLGRDSILPVAMEKSQEKIQSSKAKDTPGVRYTYDGFWTTQHPAAKAFSADWFRTHFTMIPYCWEMAVMAARVSMISAMTVVLGTIGRAIVDAAQLYAYTRFVNEAQNSIVQKNYDLERLFLLALLTPLLQVMDRALMQAIGRSSGILERKLTDLVTKQLMAAHLSLDLKQVEKPEVSRLYQEAMAAKRGRTVFAIQSNIRLFRMITSSLTQSMALIRLVSFDAWPLLLISFLQTARPIIYGLSGSSFFGVTDITNPSYYRMKTLRDVALSIENRKQVTVLGLDRWLLDEFDLACNDLPENTTYTPPNPTLRGTTHLIDGIIRECLDSALYICAAFRSDRPGINLGTVIVMRSAAATLSNSIINLHIMIESAASEFRATKSYLDCLRLTSHLRRPGHYIPYRDLEGNGMKIEAKNLHFGYSDHDNGRDVLSNVSFKIEAGETIGIVGYNGAGKSTLVNLLCRLYDSTEGRLMINGHDVEEYDPIELRKHIAVLFQEKSFLNGFSIRENVGIGQIDRLQDDEALYSAISTSGLADFIRALPKHLDTKLGRPVDDELSRITGSLGLPSSSPSEDFICPSGGQMQRIALARAFMRISEAGLLILDEPSSNLDPEAEFELFKNIKKFRRGKTTIFITHRFNTVRVADRILVLERGRVTEFGSHEELMRIPGGRYEYLYSLQKDGYQDIR